MLNELPDDTIIDLESILFASLDMLLFPDMVFVRTRVTIEDDTVLLEVIVNCFLLLLGEEDCTETGAVRADEFNTCFCC
jgi:hypothetical protein